MRIGTAFFGEVEAVGRQCIRTKFFVLGVPIAPLGSFYFTEGKRGFGIPLHGTSVLAGYLRVGLGLAFVLLAIRVWVLSSWQRSGLDVAYPVIALGLAVASLGIGRLGEMERARRTVLLRATGLAADPRVVPSEIADAMLVELASTLERRGVSLDPAAFHGPRGDGPYREAASTVPPETLGLLFAYASYAAARGNAAWAVARNALWSRVAAAAG